MLAHLLLLNGIDSIIIERNIQSNLEGRIRACVFEQDTLDLLDRIHFKSTNGQRLHLEGLVYHGIRMQFNGKRFRLPLSKLTDGKAVTIYGQHLLIEDLIADLKLKGLQIYFQVKNVEIERLDSERPMVRFQHPETDYEMHCDFVAGCDGFYGVSRASIPREILTEYERKYPFAWLCISAAVEPSCEELIYSYHQHGFALYNKRSNDLSRFYLQVSTEDSIDDWSDERIWEQLHLRLNITDQHWSIKQGEILDKTIFSVRTFMVKPMQYKQLFLVGDVAHIMSPTGAKGMNMAIADATVLSDALSEWYTKDSNDQIQSYSQKCLHRVWLAQEFAMSMSELFHRNFDLENKNDGFDQQMIFARQRNLAQSEHVQRAFAHMYTGTPS
ncbi:unnamed protein product [Didymodactylos carnosus]|uniref:FAD-binding domain-containing protein n=1 Tax=Didymodactylos carnosus TaxID=1234261 RepID=A0A8S2PS44_9BILA|nr:unnamed protein product [Didymodactylos carnosus]CAF4065372.1 unnamed protein product [Didymodactylos carnosus]